MIKVNNDTFYLIAHGSYAIGIQRYSIESMPHFSGGIKPEYLYHSCPGHEVVIKEFSISKRHVTVNEFAQFISETHFATQSQKDGWAWTWDGGWKKKEGLSWQKPFGNEKLDAFYKENADTFCVLQISCDDANAYCEYITAKSGKKAVLPTEFMWEAFAGSIGVKSIDQCTELSHNEKYTLDDYCRVLAQSCALTHTFPGYVWEWTDSYFGGYPGGAPHKEYGTTYKVLRGGSYLSHPLQKTRQYRFRRCPTARSPFYTFRICIVDTEEHAENL